MQSVQCIGLNGITRTDSCDFINFHRPKRNKYVGKNFWEDTNYRAIIDCLDEGYEVGMIVISCMKKYRDLRKEQAHQLIIYSKDCISQLETLSSLSSYGTTIEVQLKTFQSFQEQADIMTDSCMIIESVIDNYTSQINRMYPKIRFHTSRKHCQSECMKNLFKKAHAPLQKVITKLNKLHGKAKKLRESISVGTVGSKNINDSSTTNDKQIKLEEIEEQITALEKLQAKRKANYVTEATKIFQQCQQFEKERLDEMNKAFSDFIQAIHPSHYSKGIVENVKKVLLNIKIQQNSAEDVDEWARVYGIDSSTLTSVPTTTDNGNESSY